MPWHSVTNALDTPLLIPNPNPDRKAVDRAGSRSSSNLSKETEHVLRDLFEELDRDRSGTIEMRELAPLGEVLKEHWSRDDTAKLMRLLGGREDARVSFKVFCKFFEGLAGASFDELDSDRSGVLERDEGQELARVFDVDYEVMLRALDRNNNGRLMREEYVSFLLGYCLTGLRKGEVKQGLLKLLTMGRKAAEQKANIRDPKRNSQNSTAAPESPTRGGVPPPFGVETVMKNAIVREAVLSFFEQIGVRRVAILGGVRLHGHAYIQ